MELCERSEQTRRILVTLCFTRNNFIFEKLYFFIDFPNKAFIFKNVIRILNKNLYLYLCQSADWQCVVQAEDDESAATLAVEEVMKASHDNDEEYKLAFAIIVQKLRNNIVEESVEHERMTFYSPMILANAGFHVEANALEEFIQKTELENQDER